MVASPRNQRYWLPRSTGTGVLVRKVDEGCKLAKQFYPQPAFLRTKPDFLYEPTDAFRSLYLCTLGIKGLA